MFSKLPTFQAWLCACTCTEAVHRLLRCTADGKSGYYMLSVSQNIYNIIEQWSKVPIKDEGYMVKKN